MAALGFIEISGSPREAGEALGRFGADAVHAHLLNTHAWQTVTQWRGSETSRAMAALVRERFPRVWDELNGLAAGLHLHFEDVFLWNCRGDVWAMSPDGCTTVQLPGTDVRRIAHNEDGFPAFAGDCAIAQCKIDGGPGFAAFVYPGSLPGHTFAVTDNGLAITVNNLRQREVVAGVPRMVITRALLDAADIDAAVSIVRNNPRAGGFHLTLGSCKSSALVSVEFSAHDCSVVEVSAPSLHANHAIHPAMHGFAQIVTDSSRHRQIRGDALVASNETIDPLAILGDREDAALPIHRTHPDDPDEENTLATADIAIRASHIEWQVHEHPGQPARYRMINGHRQTEGTPRKRD
ncbi:peptidase C45, acyl-coenzyme A:6-aminopenicillanic acid acyl-transferase [Caballeronia fortuita]|uniref:Peptidase C45, acyl-coenzyme A:6-aminopenicillanic acid acyl-transferase n=1 Tax=Caballeronia fortuita TaxID=1777138 RepID=A0A158BKM2_9BURK|nr:C45 family peptidase [Caballeronia fortuita]SAK69877.1 peptidase C45, acyl-coenzyme A:6-aminopenicillanic acid acyl-transferase [Caballeronia fortuita]